jgi:acyl carrier protein
MSSGAIRSAIMPTAMPGHTSDETAEQIRDFLIGQGGWHRPRKELTDDVPLLNDVLDSLAVVNLVAFLESEYGVAVLDEDLEPANFVTIASIGAFVARRR